MCKQDFDRKQNLNLLLNRYNFPPFGVEESTQISHESWLEKLF